MQKPAIKAANISTFLLITLAILFAVDLDRLDARAPDHRSDRRARRVHAPAPFRRPLRARRRPGRRRARRSRQLLQPHGGRPAGGPRRAAALQRGAPVLQPAPGPGAAAARDRSRVGHDGRPRLRRGGPGHGLQSGRAPCSPSAGEVTFEALRQRARTSRPSSPCSTERGRPASGGAAPASATSPSALEGERRLEIALRPLSAASAGERGGWVVAIEDTTHVAREQKLAAWSEVARRVAHEIKNPLTPIRLSAERIARRLRAGDPDLAETIERGTKVIVEEVDFLKSLVDEFSRFARLARDAARAHGPARPRAVGGPPLRRRARRRRAARRVGTREPAGPGRPRADQARAHQPHRQRARSLRRLGRDHRAPVGRGAGGVTIEVADTGRGVPPRDRDRLFLPDFTTKGRGTGLGLAIVSRIVADHNGTIRVEDNRPRGARFIIELPAA